MMVFRSPFVKDMELGRSKAIVTVSPDFAGGSGFNAGSDRIVGQVEVQIGLRAHELGDFNLRVDNTLGNLWR